MTAHYSARFDSHVHLGKRAASPLPTAVKMADVMSIIPASALPKPPSTRWGWAYNFGATGWGMDGNGPGDADTKIPSSWAAAQGAGDCWWAMLAHKIRLLAKNAGRPIPPISDLTVIDQYGAYSGYNPQTGANDNGTEPAAAYRYLVDHPFKDDLGTTYPLAQVIQLTPGSVEEHMAATWLFQNVGVGVQLQQAQMNQFDAGKPLAYVPGSPVIGGHELLQAGPLGMIEWGCRIGFQPSFITDCNDESQATLSVEMYNAVTGLTVNHFSEIELDRYASAFVKQATQ